MKQGLAISKDEQGDRAMTEVKQGGWEVALAGSGASSKKYSRGGARHLVIPIWHKPNLPSSVAPTPGGSPPGDLLGQV